VKLIWGQYQKKEESGLAINYSNCGVKTIRSDVLMYRATLWLKRHRSTWGAGRIRLELLARYDRPIVPSERTMQRWFKEKLCTRKVSSTGTISHYGQIFSIGTKYKTQFLQLRFDISTCSWLIFDAQTNIKSVLQNILVKIISRI
jgi:hypothetical protein